MIPEFGLFCLILAFCMAFTLMMLPFFKRLPKQTLTHSLVYGQCCWVTLSFLTLLFCFSQDDFSVQYVAQNSNTALPFVYKLCALWGGHEGSLLLWSFILTWWTVGVALKKGPPPEMAQWVLSTLGAINVGFLLLLLQTSNPFLRHLPFVPQEGADLNPLLQDPAFILHPPFLYMGYVGFAVPFAFAISALILGEKAKCWTDFARPWGQCAWSFLTLGICLGSWWAYYELGWGGWWFWDPVENASLMPWLIGAALSHALWVSSKQQQFISWSLLLALCAFLLSLLGTFLVRSGVLSSVHAFAISPERGSFILGFLTIMLCISLGLYFFRASKETKNFSKSFQMESGEHTLFSKGSVILLGNMILVIATFTILLGTLYPLIMEVFGYEKLSVGTPYFNTVLIPILSPMLFIMALAPYLSWQKESPKILLRRIKPFCIVFIPIMVSLFFLKKWLSILSLLGVILGAWLITATLFKFFTNFKMPWQRWGMIIAHLGIGITVLGIALTTSLETQRELKMRVGDTVYLNDYHFSFKDIKAIEGSNFEGKQAHFSIKGNNKIFDVFPEKRFYISRQLVMTETGIKAGFFKDFYISMGEQFSDESWGVRLYIKPFVRWIWLGGLLVALGAGISGIGCFRK